LNFRQMADGQWTFLEAKFFADWMHALGAGIYAGLPTEDDRLKFETQLASELRRLLTAYLEPVYEKRHLENIRALADRLTATGSWFLKEGRFRFGLAQHALNSYLKFAWCARRILAPPHCPFDQFVVSQLPPPLSLRPWMYLRDGAEYMELVSAARAIAGDESLAEWDLRIGDEPWPAARRGLLSY
jgi:hypothetical protein